MRSQYYKIKLCYKLSIHYNIKYHFKLLFVLRYINLIELNQN